MNIPQRWCALFLAACLVALSGCSTPSINALYSEDESEVVIDGRVVGLWTELADPKDKPGGDRYRVTANPAQDGKPANWYRLAIETAAGQRKSAEFELRLVRLGGGMFLDVYPGQAETKSIGDRCGLAAMPMHVIMPVTIKDDRITVRQLDMDKVKTLLAEAPKMTPHAIKEKVAILTGSTRQVQEFFRKIAGDEAVFESPLELIRVSETGRIP